MPTFIGLDLAWTSHREPAPFESGLCVLEGREGADLRCSLLKASKLHVGALADQLRQTAGGGSPVVAAIDAPLIVTPGRKAESELNTVFHPFKAMAYKASVDWLERKDLKAGPRLGTLLRTRGFTLDPNQLFDRERIGQMALEVFPHTIHVRLFNLPQRILYKKGRVSARRCGMWTYQKLLREWLKANAPGVLEHGAVREALAAEAITDIPGSSKTGPSLKHYEDMLDGLTCALAAWLSWQKPEEWQTFGDAKNGYILAPRAPDEPAVLA